MNVLEWHNRQYRNTKPLPASPQEQPMGKYDELLKEARELATAIERGRSEGRHESVRTIHRLADALEAADRPVAVNQVGDRSELLKEVRRIADAIAAMRYNALYCVTDSARLRTLVDVVAAYDAAESEAVQLAEIRLHLINAQHGSLTELAAACLTCDEVTTRMLADSRVDVAFWADLRTIRTLAQVAVENHEKAKGGA